jgi:hypothetical protein
MNGNQIKNVGDLRLNTGRAIEDGNGTRRVELRSDRTRLFDDEGKKIFHGKGSSDTTLFAHGDQEVQINDLEGGFTAVEYKTSASPPGTLELTDAELHYNFSTKKVNFIIEDADVGTTDRNIFAVIDTKDNTKYRVSSDGTYHHLKDVNFRLDEGQAIEDDDGTSRLDLFSGRTQLNQSDGYVSIRAGISSGETRYRSDANHPWVLRDSEGSFDAVVYDASDNAPGEIKLKNARFDLNDNRAVNMPTRETFGDAASRSHNFTLPISITDSGWTDLIEFEHVGFISTAITLRSDLFITRNNRNGQNTLEFDGIKSISNRDNNWSPTGTTFSVSQNVRLKVDDNDSTLIYLQVNPPNNQDTGFISVNAGGRGWDHRVVYDNL